MNTYFIANNKTRVCAILQTDKSLIDVQCNIDTDYVDSVTQFDNIEQALKIVRMGNYKIGSFSDFL
jgi:hypothetical protein